MLELNLMLDAIVLFKEEPKLTLNAIAH